MANSQRGEGGVPPDPRTTRHDRMPGPRFVLQARARVPGPAERLPQAFENLAHALRRFDPTTLL